MAESSFEVWPGNMPVIDAFLTISTQWRLLSLADGRVLWNGLDYTAVRAGLEAAAIMLTPAQWLLLGTIERAAADWLNGTRG